jgi:hypothetical protein
MAKKLVKRENGRGIPLIDAGKRVSSKLTTKSGFLFGLALMVLAVGVNLPSDAVGAASTKTIDLPGISSIQLAIQKATSTKTLPSNLMSQLSGEAKSMFWGGGACPVGEPGTSSTAIACPLGDLQASTSVVVYGDSFSLEWAPAFNAIGNLDHFKVLLYSRVGCPFADLKTIDWEGSVDTGCLPFRENVVKAINSMNPSPNLVVLSEETNVDVPVSHWTAGVKKTILQLNQSMFPVDVIIGDAVSSTAPSTCLARFSSQITKCNSPYSSALGYEEYPQIASAVSSVHAGVINVSPLFCYDGTCPDVISDTLVHSDNWHIDQTFAKLTRTGLSSLMGCTINQLRSLPSADRLLLQSLLAGADSSLRSACASSISANGI